MEQFQITIPPQYVQQVQQTALFKRPDSPEFEGRMHEIQRVMRDDFDKLPLITEVIAPTGTGKSYAFAFPTLKAKQERQVQRKALLVLPTNVLIDELYEAFSAMFTELKIVKATKETLDKMEAKGSYKRWQAISEMAETADIMITNPDILNYAMLGGYDKHIFKDSKLSGGNTYWHFLKNFQYIIYDEFHLYREEQIASIFTMIELRECFINDSARFFFVTATPEEEITHFLTERNYRYQSISECLSSSPTMEAKLPAVFTRLEETVTQSPEESRCIHGELTIEFVLSDSVGEVLTYKEEELKAQKEQDIRSLLILNSLVDIQRLYFQYKPSWQNTHRLSEVSGYFDEGYQQADIIFSTSKSEVGANFGVDYTIMQSGFDYRSFLQRFGRTARGEMKGKIVIFFLKQREEKKQFNKLKKLFSVQEEWGYNSFTKTVKSVLQKPEFYTNKISPFMGQYLYAVYHNAGRYNYDTREYIRNRIIEMDMPDIQRGQFKFFQIINASIVHLGKGGYARQWQEWWEKYLDSYLSFRGSSLHISIKDMERNGQIFSYSKEWVLRNKAITDILEGQAPDGRDLFVVEGLREKQDNELLYESDTIPSVGAMQNRFFERKHKSNQRMRKQLFLGALKNIENGNEGIDSFYDKQEELLEKLEGLAPFFTEKRLNIIGVQGSDGLSVIF
ncbi:type I-D CRISPR-associated helicase Cas3' [Sediminitomix flava]|uniref:CRISPR-associated helicase Cas3 n=1 Tax=Sediminitomix flava TaxID=379075 RepID=A0A315ZG83_SEDFL|nr:type I-D CRISPR-associated helicase Cas3' [Sediminitomix flava]PWJ43868.1 CRISPR-associated helicase Cas3 [Sediminitomix flava]